MSCLYYISICFLQKYKCMKIIHLKWHDWKWQTMIQIPPDDLGPSSVSDMAHSYV